VFPSWPLHQSAGDLKCGSVRRSNAIFPSQCVCCDESIREAAWLRRGKNKVQADPSLDDLMISGVPNSCSLCAQDMQFRSL
jgi:hypothetical protein